MAFSIENLRKFAGNDRDMHFWSYRSADSLLEISQNDYWRKASSNICAGDIIFAVSYHTIPLEAAQFLVADSFCPTGHIVLTKLAETKS